MSCSDMLAVYRNALALSRSSHFAFHAGLRCNVSTFGMFGLSLLSSSTFRKAIACALHYHRLAAPLCKFSFREERRRGFWSLQPVSELIADVQLDKFLVEFELAAGLTLARNIMGPGFSLTEVHVRSQTPGDALLLSRMFGCAVLFDQHENLLVFDSKWLDCAPQFENETTHAELLGICGGLMDDMRVRAGVSGMVRELLMRHATKRLSLEAVAADLQMSARTLRRNLRREQTSFRRLADDLKMRLATRYLDETELPVEELAHILGFSDVAGFRRAFRRWTTTAPAQYRSRSRHF